MIKIRLSRKEIVRHLIVWSLITAFLCFVDPGQGSFIIQAVSTLLVMLSYMLAYYIHYLFIFPKFYGINNRNLILSTTSLHIIYQIINFIAFYYIVGVLGNGSEFDNAPVSDLLLNNLIFFSIVSILAFGAYRDKVSKLKIQMQNEKEKAWLIKELGFFKNQFNSHITFNFLNYCYSYVHQSSKEAAEAIELFSEMLKYTIDTKPDERVLLKNEVEYIEKFINLQKQLSSGPCIEFQSEGDITNRYILPRILITLVENAFKHGATHSIESPIVIHLQSSVNNIRLKVKNKKNHQKTVVSTGIGQYNVKQQLELFYKDQYELTIDEDKENYLCELLLTV